MWVGQLGCDVELKVLMIGNYCISQLYHQTALLPECLRKTTTTVIDIYIWFIVYGRQWLDWHNTLYIDTYIHTYKHTYKDNTTIYTMQ